ncbi:MAG: NAD-dependent dehydratase, partial [Nakamurella sp.]
RSTGAVYGASSRDPAIFTEDMSARSVPPSGPGRDAIDIEAYVRGFGRRRPDVRIAVPRFADVIGPTVVTPLTRYFALSPAVPMVLGRDARLQLVHELDAVSVLEHLALGDFSGTVNVAGDGAIMLAQAIHRAGRVPLPVPSLALDGLSRAVRTLRMGGFSPSQVKLLSAGRMLDTSRLRSEVGLRLRFSTVEAFDDFAATLRPALAPATVRRVEVRIAGTLGAVPLPDGPMAVGANLRSGAVDVIDALPDPLDLPRVDGAAGDQQPSSRPRLVGITGDAAGTPRRRRSR